MWMVVKVQGTDVLCGVLDVFTEDAIFQGLRPYSVGRQGVADYYDAQPGGMTVTYRILETRRPTEELVLGYLRVPGRSRGEPALERARHPRRCRLANPALPGVARL
jgi:hypothetical protein